MAITEISVPKLFNPVYNQIYFEVSSNNTAQCSFKYIADLYVNGVFAVRLFTYPEGASDNGFFRVDRILQDYISYDLHDNLYGFAANPNSVCEFYVEFREEYDTNSPCTGVTTITGILDTTAIFFAWNAALQKKEFVTFDDSKFEMLTDISRFLTNMPNNARIGIEDDFNINFIQLETAEPTYISVSTFDVNMAPISTAVIYNSITAASTPGEHLISVGVGPYNLNNTTLTFGSQPVIDSNVFYYSITLFFNSSPGVQVSEVKFFQLDHSCTKFQTKRPWFLNRLGGFDSYSFKLKNFRKIDINRTEYSKLLPYNYLFSDRGRTVISVNARETLTWNTDWLTELEGCWLEELFTSPEVYDSENLETQYAIIGAAYNGGFANISINPPIEISTGTAFDYEVDDGSPIGMADSGTGVITGYAGSGIHTTDVIATINVGALITGTLDTRYKLLIPMIVKSPTWEEKIKANIRKIQYAIELTPDADLNIQRA